MAVEAITDAIHGYMYEKLDDSPETDKKKQIRYLKNRKTRATKEQPDKPTKFKKTDCNRFGAPNWPRQHECPARGKKRVKCGSGKVGQMLPNQQESKPNKLKWDTHQK